MPRFRFQDWDINVPEAEEGKPQVVTDGIMLLALLMDFREQLQTIGLQLQMLNAKADAVVQAAATPAAPKRPPFRWNMFADWKSR